MEKLYTDVRVLRVHAISFDVLCLVSISSAWVDFKMTFNCFFFCFVVAFGSCGLFSPV